MQPLYSLLTYSSLVLNIEVPYTTRVPGSRHSYPVVEDGTPVSRPPGHDLEIASWLSGQLEMTYQNLSRL